MSKQTSLETSKDASDLTAGGTEEYTHFIKETSSGSGTYADWKISFKQLADWLASNLGISSLATSSDLSTGLATKEPLRYKVYRVTLTQTGVSAPTVSSTIKDEFTDPPVWYYGSDGLYYFASTDIIDAEHTPTIYKSLGAGKFLKGYFDGGGQFSISVYAADGTPTNGLLTDEEIDIRVYVDPINQTNGSLVHYPFNILTRPRTIALNLSQSSTSAPTVDAEIINEVGQYEITRHGTGDYRIASTGNFPADKTSEVLTCSNGDVTKLIFGNRFDDNTYQIRTFVAGVAADGILSSSFIEIKVFP